jgi:hypothetical protein
MVNSGTETYTVNKVGNAKVTGYNSILSKIVSSAKTKYFKSSTTFDDCLLMSS